jgi:hypothetical protein
MSSASMAADGLPERKPPRGVGLLAIATGIAGLALLAAHPSEGARTFAELLQSEAANRAIGGLVHGGFIGVLALQFVCYAVLTRRLKASVPALAGMVFFGFGATFLAGSMMMDGLVVPAIAARYAAKPDKIETARTLFVLMATMIGILMPLGLAFQSAAVAAWGAALAANGARVFGLAALVLGCALLAAAAAGFATMNPMFLMAAMAGLALWAIGAGVYLMRSA